MRASATSRFAPTASLHAARADSNTPKADEASPFALLVGAASAPAPKAANTAGGYKDSQGEDTPEPENAAADQAAPAPNTGAPPQTAVANSNSQPAQTTDTESQEDISQADADPAAAPDVLPDPATVYMVALPPIATGSQQAAGDGAPASDDTISSGDAVALWPQSARPAPQAAEPKPAKTDKGVKKDVKDQPAQPDAAAMLAIDTSRPDLQAAANAAFVPPQAPVSTPDVSTETDPALSAIPQASPPAVPAGPAVPQTTDQTPLQAPQAAAVPPTGTTSDFDAAEDAVVQDKALETAALAKSQPKPVMAPSDVKSDVKSDAKADTKTDPLKPAKPAPSKAQQNSDPAAVKSADTTAHADKIDDALKPDVAKPATPAIDTALKAAAITPPGATQPAAAQAPTITQHVQVTAQLHDAAPNLPALAVEIAAKSQSGAKQFDIRLDPPELGHVEVRLSIDATGKASAHLSADQPQTLTLLQKDAQILTRALREAGLDVSQDGLNFSLRQQANHDNGAGAQSGHRSRRGFSAVATTSIEATAGSAVYSGAADGRLDIRV